MAITELSGGTTSLPSSWLADYDDVAQTIGLTCTGVGHGTLTVRRSSTNVVLGSVFTDQFGTTSGQLTNGQSNGPVTYDGTRHIVLGPGATGVDTTGRPLSTSPVPSSVVGLIAPPKGTQPGLYIEETWIPN